ncbi:hypothetical protein QBC38DRAFT_459389 [Podospora fimiseda]|uniref:Ecp2 effector protein-like domain-containing protein n=1 Tax=Podospora fimiseda TaxID=252190 RepID=A0AAN7GX33_9PEZI|nr:hypothetical protein QBC38DRAFT_459389 [Podospora fimiseda]
MQFTFLTTLATLTILTLTTAIPTTPNPSTILTRSSPPPFQSGGRIDYCGEVTSSIYATDSTSPLALDCKQIPCTFSGPGHFTIPHGAGEVTLGSFGTCAFKVVFTGPPGGDLKNGYYFGTHYIEYYIQSYTTKTDEMGRIEVAALVECDLGDLNGVLDIR